MHSIITLLTFFIFYTSTLGQSTIFGIWEGAFQVRGTELKIYMDIKEENDVLHSYLTVPDQMLKQIKSSNASYKDDTLRVAYNMFGASYEGVLANNGKNLNGTWTQGQVSEMNLTRIDQIPVVNRPQEPKPPFPYKSEDVIFFNTKDNIKMGGTLTLPNDGSGFPAVILVSGSGQQDRNSEIAEHKPFLVISDYLTRNGIAVLRYDDRGIGETTGNPATSTTKDFANDAAAAVRYLKSRNEIDPAKIGVVGHSEGGMIAPMVGNIHKDIGFLVLLAAPAEPIPELMVTQNRNIFRQIGLSDEELEKNENYNRKIFNIIASDSPTTELFDTIQKLAKNYYNSIHEDFRPMFGPTQETYYISLASQLFSPWFRGFMQYDSKEYLKNIKCPVLAVNGSDDIQVPSKSNLDAVVAGLALAENKDVTIQEFESLNHLFQKCSTCTVNEYAQLEETFSVEVLEFVSSWIQERFIE